MGNINILGNGGGSAEGSGLPPSNCRNIVITKTTTKNILKWEDPKDTILDMQYLCSWGGTKIVRKIGSYPKDPEDGTLIIDNTTRNNYLSSGYEDDTIVSGTNYYYRAFPYSVNGVYNLDTKNCFVDAIIYGFAIDKTDSNPATRVSYISGCDNEDFTPAYMNFSSGSFNYGSWENAFFMPRPVMLKSDATVDYELNPNDYTLKQDGTASDIANSSYDGNVMIGFPQVWFKFVNNGSRQEVYISNKQVDDNYKCYTHYNRLNELVDEIFVGAYDGSIVSTKLRCISGLAPCNTQAGTTEITYAANNGTYWTTGVLSDWQMINMLLILIGKSTNTQAVFGNGHYTGGNSAGSLYASGSTNTKGMFWGSNGNDAVKVFGIENFYGNVWKRIAGWINASGTQKVKMTYGTQDGTSITGYNTDGAGYIPIGLTPSGTSGGYISSSTLNEYGLFPQVASGSDSTYFCDGLWFNNGQVNYALVGCYCVSGSVVGAFASRLDYAVSASYWSLGASLSCKPPLQ